MVGCLLCTALAHRHVLVFQNFDPTIDMLLQRAHDLNRVVALTHGFICLRRFVCL
jgi:hypothetical protein